MVSLKIHSKLILVILLSIANFQFCFGSSQTDLPSSNNGYQAYQKEIRTENINEYFKCFAEKSGTDHVMYLEGKNKLIFFAHPSALNDFFLTITGLFCIGMGGFCTWFTPKAWYDLKEKDLAIFTGLIAAGCAIGTIASFYFVYKNYKMRNGFVPYLTFDSTGVKKFDKYILEWRNVERAKSEELHHAVTHMIGNQLVTEDVTELITTYTDKYGEVLFKLSGNDSYLPVSYESTIVVFNHCLAAFGNEQFRSNQ